MASIYVIEETCKAGVGDWTHRCPVTTQVALIRSLRLCRNWGRFADARCGDRWEEIRCSEPSGILNIADRTNRRDRTTPEERFDLCTAERAVLLTVGQLDYPNSLCPVVAARF